MASSSEDEGDTVDPRPKIAPEQQQLLKTLAEMDLMPKADSPEDLRQWMQDYLKSTEGTATVKKEPDPAKPLDVKPKTTTSTKPSFTQPPKIPNFSGLNRKGETSYDLWRYEVTCLQKEKLYHQDVIIHAVRHSLREEAGRIAMRLGTDASVQQIIQKLDSVYGNVEKKEELMAEFYGARQRPDEDVSTWSCRLEDIIGKATERGLVTQKETDAMLHAMLWTGLKPSLKDISAHKYDTIKDFDGLRVALRQIEKDHAQRETTKTQTAKAITPGNSEVAELKTMIRQLTEKVNKIEEKQDSQTRGGNQQFGNRPWKNRGNQWQHNTKPKPHQQQQQPQYQQQQQPQYQQQQQQQGTTQQNRAYRKDIQCYRCGQYGHIARGCRIRMDHSKKDLNTKRPMEGDHR